MLAKEIKNMRNYYTVKIKNYVFQMLYIFFY